MGKSFSSCIRAWYLDMYMIRSWWIARTKVCIISYQSCGEEEEKGEGRRGRWCNNTAPPESRIILHLTLLLHASITIVNHHHPCIRWWWWNAMHHLIDNTCIHFPFLPLLLFDFSKSHHLSTFPSFLPYIYNTPPTRDHHWQYSKPHESQLEVKPQGSNVSLTSTFISLPPFLLSFLFPFLFSYTLSSLWDCICSTLPNPSHHHLARTTFLPCSCSANNQSLPRPPESPPPKPQEVSRSPTGTGPVPSPWERSGGIISKFSFAPWEVELMIDLPSCWLGNSLSSDLFERSLRISRLICKLSISGRCSKLII